MKKLIPFCLLVVLLGCQEYEDFTLEEISREFTTLGKDVTLQSMVGNIGIGNREDDSPLDRADWDNVYKVDEPNLSLTTYTIPLFQQQSRVFEKLVLISNSNQEYGIVFRYTPSGDWYENHFNEMTNYTGMLEVLDMYMEPMISSV